MKRIAIGALALLLATGCTRTAPDAPAAALVEAAAPVSVAAAAPVSPPEAKPVVDATLPIVLVRRDPGCGCCELWVAHMQQAGFSVQMQDEPQMEAFKRQLGIPSGKESCHTAQIGDYVFEGHVPAQDIKRFLAEKPKAKGLVLPGMPLGSPGMEVPGTTPRPYTVERLEADGSTTPYAEHGG